MADYLIMCSECEVRMHPDDYNKHKVLCGAKKQEYIPQPMPALPYPIPQPFNPYPGFDRDWVPPKGPWVAQPTSRSPQPWDTTC